ncbi:MAG: hypothetical protein COY40_00835 [Alphaproteobacteria bacterium CG_4_10_14_0_8_um_filter_53_9]|nr:MAG: hypothetical protein COY40_00835 [Alphaproteobacteria bacterium CG_4_10_14_0_8_um_filter_53_9]
MALSKNARLGLLLAALGLAMLGVAYAMVPLYRLFCQALGIPVPTIQVGQTASLPHDAPITDRAITIRFTANQSRDVPVDLKPTQFVRNVHIGESVLTAYTAYNTSPVSVSGTAVHMLYAQGGAGEQDVTPYVELQQCFCFEEQYYPGHEKVNLPLSFRVSEDLPPEVHTITFSYTLFKSLD